MKSPFWSEFQKRLGLPYHPLMLLGVDHKEWPTECMKWRGAKTGKTGGAFPLIYNPVTQKMELAHKFLFECLVQPLKFGESLKNTCDSNGCCHPLHWRVVKRKPNGFIDYTLTEEEVRELTPRKVERDEIDELVELVEGELAIAEPSSLQELMERPTMLDWSISEVTEAITRIGGRIAEKLLK